MMTSEEQWLIDEARRQASQATNYADQAFYQAFADFCAEQAHQAELMRGEIDGRTWNHEAW
jgi:hypothetical protein